MNLIKCGETRDTVLRWLAKTLMANRGRGKIHVRADQPAEPQPEPKVAIQRVSFPLPTPACSERPLLRFNGRLHAQPEQCAASGLPALHRRHQERKGSFSFFFNSFSLLHFFLLLYIYVNYNCT